MLSKMILFHQGRNLKVILLWIDSLFRKVRFKVSFAEQKSFLSETQSKLSDRVRKIFSFFAMAWRENDGKRFACLSNDWRNFREERWTAPLRCAWTTWEKTIRSCWRHSLHHLCERHIQSLWRISDIRSANDYRRPSPKKAPRFAYAYQSLRYWL